ncbi:MAG: uridine kinase [Acutalibacteraceae bacterium]
MKNTDYSSAKLYSVEEINAQAISNPQALTADSDCHFRLEIHAAVEEILERSENGGVIMLSGPSSAGKTTTSMMLRHLLSDKGRTAVKISLDDFFLAADETPLDKNGKRDFESIRALNLDEIKSCLLSLSQTGECFMPKYDFTKRRPSNVRQHIKIERDGFVIIEGLHAINPVLTNKITGMTVTKIFLNVESSVDVDGELLDGLTLRMLRRLVRDTSYRSTDAQQCFEHWDSVVAGERENILPFIGTSDIIIDSFHKSEPGIIGCRAIPVLLSVPKESEHYDEAQRLAALLRRVRCVDLSFLDHKSLLTEFVGGGSYEY